jgi:lipopolysaccharide/colanic/teichoic acid biosynthesis glycosyltransferase
MDLEYIRRLSFWFDAGLILWTIYLIVVRAPLMVLGVRPKRVQLPELVRGGSRA